MEKDFNTGLRKSLEADRIKLTRRRKQLLRDMGYSEDLDSAEIAEKLHEQVRANDVLNRSVVRQEEEIKKLKARIMELETGQKPIAKHRDYIFTFLASPAVPPTNNDSEKALRPAKTKFKVSGCFRTEAGVQNYATVASVIQTAVKNGQNPFEALRVIATLALT